MIANVLPIVKPLIVKLVVPWKLFPCHGAGAAMGLSKGDVGNELTPLLLVLTSLFLNTKLFYATLEK